jgi:hypothetical protein
MYELFVLIAIVAAVIMSVRVWIGKAPGSRVLKQFAILAGLALTIFVSYKVVYHSLSVHVRLAIEVELRGEPKVGSSVIDISTSQYPTLLGLLDSGVDSNSRGEAVFLDLGGGNNLIALLGLGGGSRDDIITITQNAFFDDRVRSNPEYGTAAYADRILAAEMGHPKELGLKNMPTLARFRDLSDPKTIEAVDPNNLEASYGSGVIFRRATLEITNDPITSGVIEARLPWLHAMIGDDPYRHFTVYHVGRPELSQDTIFYVGFIRK